jgi:hypothetical protein
VDGLTQDVRIANINIVRQAQGGTAQRRRAHSQGLLEARAQGMRQLFSACRLRAMAEAVAEKERGSAKYWSEWQDLNLRRLVPNEVLYRLPTQIRKRSGSALAPRAASSWASSRTGTKAKEKANGRVQILHTRACKSLNQRQFRPTPSSALPAFPRRQPGAGRRSAPSRTRPSRCVTPARSRNTPISSPGS